MTNVDKTVTRRTILRNAAWAAPVIAVSVGAPAASASGLMHGAITLSTDPSACVPTGTTLTATGTVWDRDGQYTVTEATFFFYSTDGGTVVIDGEVYPGSTVPVTRPGSSGVGFLSGITAGSTGTVTVGADMTLSDGRHFGYDTPGFLLIC